jgi:hypothetical protein
MRRSYLDPAGVLLSCAREDRDNVLLQRAIGTANGTGRQWLRPAIFRRRQAAFASRNKIAGLRHPPLCFGRSVPSPVQVRSARRLSSP